MKFRNISEFRQVVVIGGIKTQLMPGDVFESDREIKIAFLEKVSDNTEVTVRPGKKFASMMNLHQKVSTLQSDSQELKQSSIEIQSLREKIIAKDEEIRDLTARQEKLELETQRKLEMMKSAIMMIQEDFYNVEFDESGKAVEKDPNFRT